jgi:hypothetical protein
MEEHITDLNEIMCRPITSSEKMLACLEYIGAIVPPGIDLLKETIDMVQLHGSFTFTLCKDILDAMTNAEHSSCDKLIMGVYGLSFTYLELFEYYKGDLNVEYSDFEDEVSELTNKIQNFQVLVEEKFRDRPISLTNIFYVNLYLNAAKRSRATLDII